MERFYLFWKQYQKECLVVLALMILLVGGFGGFLLYRKNQPEKNVAIQEEVVKEKDISEEPEEESSFAQQEIRVDVKGEVKTPGVYIMTSENRIIDAIEKAGGLTKNADTSVNNLSRKLQDEMVVIVYSKKEVENFSKTKEKESEKLSNVQNSVPGMKNDAALTNQDILTNQNNSSTSTNLDEKNDSKEEVSDSSGQVSQKVSINTATKEELMQLKGIGESKAQAIVDYRKEFGNFTKIEDIMLVSGIGESVFEKIKAFIQI